MGQITIYLDDELEARLKATAAHENVSRSRWIASLIRERLRDEWPEEVRALAGSWKDFPDLSELRADLGTDVRECL